MAKELTDKESLIQRQNILNNQYAISEIEKATALKCIKFEGKSVLLKEQVSSFFEVTTRTIDNYIASYGNELRANGYELIESARLNALKSAIKDSDDHEIDFAIINKSARLAIFDFRAFLNMAMLLKDSPRAAILRRIILDITIKTITNRGGNPKYINQRADGFLYVLYDNQSYRKEFTDALDFYLDLGNIKYAIYTNKIYQCIFAEKAEEYRAILKLKKKDKIRETMYGEILNLISAFETEIANALKNAYTEKLRKLVPQELDRIFDEIAARPLFKPLINSARRQMASRDLAFRDILHDQLREYVTPIDPVEFERFLGETSKSLAIQMDEAKDVLKRLKEDSHG